MRAMVLIKPYSPLKLLDFPVPTPKKGQVLIRVHTCAVCRTDLHIADGELPQPKLPLILGHQVVGEIVQLGSDPSEVETLGFKIGDRVGVPWLNKSCGMCHYCKAGKENLCPTALYTGYTVDGGFAEYCVAEDAYIFHMPEKYNDEKAAPLLCSGFIGYRAWRFVEGAKRVGFYGFGSSAHLIVQIACLGKSEIYVFTKPGDINGQTLAKNLGAKWVGDSTMLPNELLDAAIIFAPDGTLVPKALKAIFPGGIVVCAGIHMSDIPSFPYELLWGERVLRSVANLTRQDGKDFLELAAKASLQVETTTYPLEEANLALKDLREGHHKGSIVLKCIYTENDSKIC
ncbi:MAG: zinc-dependent alcohol dehydrogenase family protein [Anaerolineae bacterium]